MSTLMPNVSVTLENTPYPEYEQKVITELAAGTAADVILVDGYWSGDLFVLGKFEPLNRYLTSLGDNANAWFTKNWVFDPRKECSYNGNIFGLTLIEGLQMGVFINNQLAEKAGMLDDAPSVGHGRL